MFSRKEKILLGLLAAIQFLHLVDFMIIMPLGPQLMRLMKIDPHEFGLLVSVYTFSAAFSGLMASLFIDRFDRRTALLFFFGGFTLATLACGLSSTYGMLLGARSLAGTFGGVMWSLLLSIIGDAINQERRGTAMGILMASFSLASVFGVPAGLYFSSHYNFQAPFLVLVVLAVGVGWLLWRHLPSMRGHLEGMEVNVDPLFALKHIMQTPNQLLAIAFMFFLVFGQFSIIPYIAAALVGNAGLSESQLPLMYLFGGLMSLFASPFFGRLSDRYGKKRIFYVGASLSMIPMYLVTHLGQTSVAWALGVTTSFFFVMSGRMVPGQAINTSVAEPKFRGSYISVSTCIQQLGSSLSSYFAGWVIVQGESGELLHYSTVGWTGIGFTVLAMLAVARVRSVA